MNRTLTIDRTLLLFGIPVLIFGALIVLIKSSIFQAGTNSLTLGITLDLLVTVPFIYSLLIRKTEIPKVTVVSIMIIGMLIGTLVLPANSQLYLGLFKMWVLPIVELSIVTFIVWKVRYGIKNYKAIEERTPDFYTALKETCYEILPKKVALPLSTEIAVMYYGFIKWKSKKLEDNEFSYHKKSGTPALLGVIILIILIEMISLHIVLALWSPLVAWILTGLSAYTGLQIFGFAKSLSMRPIVIKESTLLIRFGILNEVEIPFADIDKIELSRKFIEENEKNRKLSPLGELDSHNVVLHLKKENTLNGFYGIKKNFQILALHVDEAEAFRLRIKEVLES